MQLLNRIKKLENHNKPTKDGYCKCIDEIVHKQVDEAYGVAKYPESETAFPDKLVSPCAKCGKPVDLQRWNEFTQFMEEIWGDYDVEADKYQPAH